MTGVERAAELQEGSGTNKPGGEEDTEQKGGEARHWNKAASLFNTCHSRVWEETTLHWKTSLCLRNPQVYATRFPHRE